MPPWLIVALPLLGCLGVIVFLALLVGLASRRRKRREDPAPPPRHRRWIRDGNMLSLGLHCIVTIQCHTVLCQPADIRGIPCYY
ncbi:hypothetical protein NP493_228g04017 [Ridgeia piscesae]|uniref:Uncharacterized protein n=1 Tax=Ridgeia piscesae TaxID=27915 RepID=A0AAD9NZZ8_RIDPI|nr:hypothetical protein NP493_228g04017 [Ridgeia piscesae]